MLSWLGLWTLASSWWSKKFDPVSALSDLLITNFQLKLWKWAVLQCKTSKHLSIASYSFPPAELLCRAHCGPCAHHRSYVDLFCSIFASTMSFWLIGRATFSPQVRCFIRDCVKSVQLDLIRELQVLKNVSWGSGSET